MIGRGILECKLLWELSKGAGLAHLLTCCQSRASGRERFPGTPGHLCAGSALVAQGQSSEDEPWGGCGMHPNCGTQEQQNTNTLYY